MDVAAAALGTLQVNTPAAFAMWQLPGMAHTEHLGDTGTSDIRIQDANPESVAA